MPVCSDCPTMRRLMMAGDPTIASGAHRPRAWGQGYATEALRAIVDLAPTIGVRQLDALCHPEHHASVRVLEKCGFVADRAWFGETEFPNLAPGMPQRVVRYVRMFAG